MKTLLFSLALLSAALGSGYAQTNFRITPGHADTRIQFTSKAPMETVTGTTHNATGFIEFDPAGTGEGARGEVHVDLASLKTGIDLRDKHMRQDHLETGKYPEAVFTLTALTLPAGGLPDGKRTRVTVQGTFKIHGVEKNIEPETYMTLRSSDGGSALQVESDFTVNLGDYRIPRPQFLLMRLAEDQKVHIELHAVSGEAAASSR